MHDDLGNDDLRRRLRVLANADGKAPYDWAEFQRRRRARGERPREFLPRRLAVAASVLLLVSAAGALGYYLHAGGIHFGAAQRGAQVALVRSSPCSTQTLQRDSRSLNCAHASASDSPSAGAQLWFADLPRAPVVQPVGTQVAETGLVDQIATLDQLLSAERVAHARPARVAALERQRAQLVGSLAEFRYAELLAAASR